MAAEVGFFNGFVATADRTCLHYLEAGIGPDLLLVPGSSLTAALWRHQIVEHSRSHRVIELDHRGQGLSDKPGPRLPRGPPADTHEVIEILGLTDLTWIGHSMGCASAGRTGTCSVATN
jgi:non-heme chloroperoxidase